MGRIRWLSQGKVDICPERLKRLKICMPAVCCCDLCLQVQSLDCPGFCSPGYGKGKVKLSLFLTKHYTMKVSGGVDV
jgi:hypothetical protein